MQVGFLLFPHVTQLDFTGPIQVLHRLPGATTHVIAQSREPLPTDCGFSIVPTCTFQEAPPLDLLCIPGGFGVSNTFSSHETLDFVAQAAEQATWITSVCTGAFVLGVAGVLDGHNATTHWAYRHLLPLVGATPVEERVVRDGKLLTGGGVTAGIDFAFALVAEIAGESLAQEIQLALEYNPAPPPWQPAQDNHTKRVQEQYSSRINTFAGLVQQSYPRPKPSH